jgi:hypothetical protein
LCQADHTAEHRDVKLVNYHTTAPPQTDRVQFNGLWKQVTTNFCEHPSKFKYNNNFEIVRGQKYFTDDMRLNFTPSPLSRKDPFYFNQHGPTVYYPSVVLGDCATSLNAAITRLSNARSEEYTLNGLKFTIDETMFRHNQRVATAEFINSDIFSEIKSMMSTTIDLPDLLESLDNFVKLPHTKRKPREQCWEQDQNTGDINRRIWLKRIIGKIKRGERAKYKPGKPALSRLINDLGVAASLQGAQVTEEIKKVLASNPIFGTNYYLKYVKSPDFEQLVEAFTNLTSCEHDYAMIYHSDDSCITIPHKRKGPTTYNMDISKCDSSHMQEIFDILLYIFKDHPFYNELKILVEQLMVNLVLINPGGSEYVELKTLRAILYSGTTLSTLINNIANILIFYKIRQNKCTTEEEIMIAAAEAGYIVTLEECDRLEKITFLKSFPHITTPSEDPYGHGRMTICPCLGIPLRSSGACKGDLPGRGDIELRAADFQYAVIHGMFPASQHPLILSIKGHSSRRNVIKLNSKIRLDFELDYKLSGVLHENVYTSALCIRYDCETEEVVELTELFTKHRFGFSIRTALTDKILSFDYQYVFD